MAERKNKKLRSKISGVFIIKKICYCLIMEKKNLGNLGEELAVKFLKKKGYLILERNWRAHPKEIDIVAKKDGVIVFAEVKTRIIQNENPNRFLAEESIGPQKRKALLSACKYYLFSKKIPADTPWQIDVVSVEINPETNKSEIHHFANEIY